MYLYRHDAEVSTHNSEQCPCNEHIRDYKRLPSCFRGSLHQSWRQSEKDAPSRVTGRSMLTLPACHHLRCGPVAPANGKEGAMETSENPCLGAVQTDGSTLQDTWWPARPRNEAAALNTFG
jgi:hypothetical protein